MLKTKKIITLTIRLLLFSYFCQGQRYNIPEICKRIGTWNNYSSFKCQKVNECSHAKEVISAGRAILCGFQNGIQQICCPVTTLVTITTPSTISQRPPIWGGTQPITIRQTTGTTRTTTTTARTTTSTARITTSTARVTTSTTRQPLLLRKSSADIAWEKCREYSKAINVTQIIPGQFTGEKDTVIVVQDCHKVEELIVNGIMADPKEFPHMALIGYQDPFSSVVWACGGSLISEQFVLSAAHCGKSALGEAKWVLLGDLDISVTTDEATPQVYRIIRRYDHPNYTSSLAYNDITLFKLNTTVIFSPFIRPICLHTTEAVTSKRASVSGWGRTGTVEAASEHLLKTTIDFIAGSSCQKAYGGDSNFNRGFDSKSMVCAGDALTGNDTCGGDSGGPLQIPIPNMICMWAQVGVTSIGPGICGDTEVPSIYTRVSNYLNWIQSIVWPN